MHYDNQVAWFLDRLPLSEGEFVIIQVEAHEMAWLVAQNIQLKLCQSVLDRIDIAVEEDQPFEEFKKDLAEWLP